ncbi:MAG: winged helix-turn-helix transcriptional regulator [Crenarchaeota archaeon]|nr:winged helix-turn-helix transcriptional regulator [Thermoproteota archaeon]
MMEKLIEFAMCGREGEKCRPYKLTAPLERQRILLLINSEPANAEHIAERLGISVNDVMKHIEELLRCGLVIEEDGKFRPGFAIFTVKDQEVLLPLIYELTNDVINIIKQWLPEVHKALKNLTIVRRGLQFRELEYITVGALTLDYEGLEVLSEEGLIMKSRKMPGDGEYIFVGFERGPLNPREIPIWGHGSIFGKYWFNTHGNIPPTGIRLAFPDLAWLWDAQRVEIDMVNNRMIEIGMIIETLAEEDLSFRDLQKKLNIDPSLLMLDLALLLSIRYVTLLDMKKYRINIPVLTSEDYTSIRDLSRKILRNIAQIFKSKSDKIRETYSKTTPARNNIPLEEAFNQIYHIIFGRALNELIEKNIIAGPGERPDGGRYSAFMIVLD